MKNIYNNYLFQKHILVSEGSISSEDVFPTLFSMASLFNVKIISGEKLAQPSMIRTLAANIGQNVPEPFYRGFPQSVRELSSNQRLFDQFVHYVKTYGFNMFDEAGHSVLEKSLTRLAFKENTELKEFTIVSEIEAVNILGEIVEDLLKSTRPINDDQYALVLTFIHDFDYKITNCASKNTAIKLLLDTRNIEYAAFINMSDVIRLVDELNYKEYNNDNVKKLNLRNQDRKFITAVINELFSSDKCDLKTCFEKKSIWVGLLHHIHYKPFDDVSSQFVSYMRGSENHSAYSDFEKAMAIKDIKTAVSVLKENKSSAAILRNLNYIVSRCTNEEDISFIMNNLDSDNVIVLIQLLMQYSSYIPGDERRTFKFSKHNKLLVHTETDKEVIDRKSGISQYQAELLCLKIQESLCKVLKGRLGKVYIDPNMERIALPLQENTSQGGYGVLSKGSRIHIEEGKKVRAFTYWEKVNDIDLSVIGIDENGKQTEFSWRSMWGLQSKAITFSGDQTSGYYGGSEYFDIDIPLFKEEHPTIKYLVFCDNVFSGSNFSECFCKAGYMTRDVNDSGQVFEPKTVKSSFIIDCESTFAYLFGIDLVNNDFIWLNVARESNARVAGSTSLRFMTQYFNVTSIINVYSFFEMMATSVVSDPMEADVVVTDKPVSISETAEVIHSYDFERIMALMNE